MIWVCTCNFALSIWCYPNAIYKADPNMYWFRTHLAPIIMNQNLAVICVTAYSVYIIDTSSAFPAVVRCTLHSDDSAILQVYLAFNQSCKTFWGQEAWFSTNQYLGGNWFKKEISKELPFYGLTNWGMGLGEKLLKCFFNSRVFTRFFHRDKLENSHSQIISPHFIWGIAAANLWWNSYKLATLKLSLLYFASR